MTIPGTVLLALILGMTPSPSTGQTEFAVSGVACELGKDPGNGLRTTGALLPEAKGTPTQVPRDLSGAQCSYDGVITRLELSELAEMSRSSQVVGHALGTGFALTPSGLEAVRRVAVKATVR